MHASDVARLATPIGLVEVAGDDRSLHRITILTDGAPARASAEAVARATEQLEQWFAGERHAFDLSLAPPRTPRGGALRDAIVAVGFGETVSYGAVAKAAGSSARAVGQACARNPFPLVVPCHRILGSADLGHYSAGEGLATKRWLLAHERVTRTAS